MARPLRVDVHGGWYHVTARGNERRAIFRDGVDRGRFLRLLGESVEQFGLALHAYVLMDSHYHLLVETPQANLSDAMQWLGVGYTVGFNHRHRRVGHLFQGRFKAILLEAPAAVEVSRYVHLNPVRVRGLGLDKPAQLRSRQGLAEKPGAALVRERLGLLRQYRWSSYPAYAGLAETPPWLATRAVLEMLGRGSQAERQRRYRQFVDEPVREGLLESPWERVEAGLLLGTAAFVRRCRKLARGDTREQPQLKRLRARPGLTEVVRAVERLRGEPWERFRDRHGDWGRDLVLYGARRHCGVRLRELAVVAGGLNYGSVAVAVQRFEQRLQNDPLLRRHDETIRNQLLQC
ncbi:MAG TPA: transposase [Verrucomicrobiae bacterium]|nr:transposase [Verrucomicrobiae bacterium]